MRRAASKTSPRGAARPACRAPGSLPADSESHPVSATAEGLEESTAYRFRLVAANSNGAYPGKAVPFSLGAPQVETIGSEVRTASTARLDARIYPHGLSTEYRFQYGTAGPCEANPCASTSLAPGPSGDLTELLSRQLAGLTPGATYHYRVLADNGGPWGEVAGAERTLTTRSSDAPPSHGPFAGPPGSDRAWELVSAPESGGNPVNNALGVSSEGDRVIYKVNGGSPGSPTGTLFNTPFAERSASGWQTLEGFLPPRSQAPYNGWFEPAGAADLSSLLTLNIETGQTAQAGGVWRLGPGRSAEELYAMAGGQYGGLYLFSDGGSRALLLLKGSLDPAHPAAPESKQLYDVSGGAPQLVGLLPGGEVPSCGVATGPDPFTFPQNVVRRVSHWLAADGSRVFFPSAGDEAGCSTPHLYVRDLVGGQSRPVDQLETSPGVFGALSGPDCQGAFIKSTPAAAYFWTRSRLVGEDSAVGGCEAGEGGDVYRYALPGGGLECLTCAVPGADVALNGGKGGTEIALAADGSRLYFKSAHHLLGGANPEGESGLYRLRIADGDLAYVGPIGSGIVGDSGSLGEAISSDGRFLAFRSSDPGLDSLSDSQNGGGEQYYLYDDGERSLTCVSCPADGSRPRAAVPVSSVPNGVGPNLSALADDGTFAFSTPTALVAADQNSAPAGQGAAIGNDVYEWRDGRRLLVSDGLTAWPADDGAGPKVAAVTPSGRDVFFSEAAQLTPDALDGYRRLYDARVGAEPRYPEEAPPCPLEVCQGTPKGAPEAADPGSAHLVGPGNLHEAPRRPHCPKGRRRVRRHGKVRCLRRRRHHRHRRHHRRHGHRANHDRRNHR